MKVKINIDCESGIELLNHLSVIRRQVKSKIAEAKKKDIKKPISMSDNNCYGDHNIFIKEFSIDELIH